MCRLGTMQMAIDAITEAPTAQKPSSGVKLTFRLNVVDPSRLTGRAYASAQGLPREDE